MWMGPGGLGKTFPMIVQYLDLKGINGNKYLCLQNVSLKGVSSNERPLMLKMHMKNVKKTVSQNELGKKQHF